MLTPRHLRINSLSIPYVHANKKDVAKGSNRGDDHVEDMMTDCNVDLCNPGLIRAAISVTRPTRGKTNTALSMLTLLPPYIEEHGCVENPQNTNR